MLLLYAALHTVDRELLDAAHVDGAGRLRSLWHVTLPQIRPVLLVNTILITIATLNTFDMILSLTGGGPAQATEVLALHTYNSVFVNFNLAGGCVFALLLLVAGLVLTFLYRRLLREEAL
jgi:multiple sugar transport system permease protein